MSQPWGRFAQLVKQTKILLKFKFFVYKACLLLLFMKRDSKINRAVEYIQMWTISAEFCKNLHESGAVKGFMLLLCLYNYDVMQNMCSVGRVCVQKLMIIFFPNCDFQLKCIELK